MQLVKSIVISTVVFLVMDGLWLGFIAKPLYIQDLGYLLRLQNNNIVPNLPAAILVYVLLIGGLLIFVLPKAGYQPLLALGWGALFGLICYGTYDFTNLAVVAKWPWRITLIDVIWGSVICGVTSCITAWLR